MTHHDEMLAKGLDYCAGHGDYVPATDIRLLTGFPICLTCRHEYMLTLVEKRLTNLKGGE